MPTTLEPIVRTDIDTELLTEVREERQVVIYMESTSSYGFYADPLAVLVDQGSGQESKLVGAYNVDLYPTITPAREGQPRACLVFESLPKDCAAFDLVEPKRPLMRPWIRRGIARNVADVYALVC